MLAFNIYVADPFEFSLGRGVKQHLVYLSTTILKYDVKC